jgi:hypothetical protein
MDWRIKLELNKNKPPEEEADEGGVKVDTAA